MGAGLKASGWFGRLIGRQTQSRAPGRGRPLLLGALAEQLVKFSETPVEDVMTPRAAMQALPLASSVRAAADCMRKHRLASLPLYRGALDNIAGVVSGVDLLSAAAGRGGLQRIMRKPLRFSPAMRAIDALYAMTKKGAHGAVIYDESGGVSGFVSMEELLAALGGELDDRRFEKAPPSIEPIKGGFVADARCRLEDAAERAGFKASESEGERCDTLGGLVFSLAERVPARGELIPHASGWTFTVLEADMRRIRRLQLTPPARRRRPAGGAS